MSQQAIRRNADDLASLLERSARGDEQAFAQFYDATAARVYGVALRVVRNPALAEEVAQDSYLDAWRLSDRYDHGRGSALAWLLVLVQRRAVDRVRSAEAAARRDDTYLRRALTGADVDTTSVAALASVEARQVRAALGCLTPQQRRAISLAYFNGLTHTEVAAAVGAPLGTVKFWIRDGMRKLRPALEPLAFHAT